MPLTAHVRTQFWFSPKHRYAEAITSHYRSIKSFPTWPSGVCTGKHTPGNHELSNRPFRSINGSWNNTNGSRSTDTDTTSLMYGHRRCVTHKVTTCHPWVICHLCHRTTGCHFAFVVTTMSSSCNECTRLCTVRSSFKGAWWQKVLEKKDLYFSFHSPVTSDCKLIVMAVANWYNVVWVNAFIEKHHDEQRRWISFTI